MSEELTTEVPSSTAIVVAQKEMENFELKMELKLHQLKSAMELAQLKQQLDFQKQLQELKIQRLEERQTDIKEWHEKELQLVKEQHTKPAYMLPHYIPPNMSRFFGSILLPLHLEYHLISWLGSSNWNLVYRASTHGDSSSTFHSMCDNKAGTVVIVNVGGFIFGGFNPVCWNSASGNYFNAPGSFLFTLLNSFNDPPTLFSCKNLANAVYCNNSYGPTWGSGHDLHIQNSARSSSASYCNLGHGYNDTLGRGQKTFTGAYQFTVTDYEVFVRC